jgi:hypothetical protein
MSFGPCAQNAAGGSWLQFPRAIPCARQMLADLELRIGWRRLHLPEPAVRGAVEFIDQATGAGLVAWASDCASTRTEKGPHRQAGATGRA